MKKSIAVLSVITQMSIYKIIMVLLFLGISQVTFVYAKMKQYTRDGVAEKYVFANYMDNMLLLFVFVFSFLLINMILCWTYREKRGAHTAYFWERIRIGRKQKLIINMLYAWFCYFLLYGWQIVISRMIEWMVSSMALQEGETIYQYVRGIYFSDLLSGIYAGKSVLLLGLLSIEVAKSQWRNKPSLCIILIIVWDAVTYAERSYRYATCIEWILDLCICILYIDLNVRKYRKNEKNIGMCEEKE